MEKYVAINHRRIQESEQADIFTDKTDQIVEEVPQEHEDEFEDNDFIWLWNRETSGTCMIWEWNWNQRNIWIKSGGLLHIHIDDEEKE